MVAADAPRITLFLPGLFTLPLREAPAALLAGLGLPVLARLLGRGAAAPAPARGIETALFHLFGHPTREPPSAAAATAVMDGVAADGHWVLRADPVHLHTDISKAILFGPDTFRLDAAEATALVRDIVPLAAARDWRLEMPAPARWYLVADEPLTIEAGSPKRLAGADVRRHLPGGPEGAQWRGVLNEIQMTLHDHPVNRAREARGEPVVNSLWIWGGGVPVAPGAHRWTGVWGGDDLLRALAGEAWRGPAPAAAPPPRDMAPGVHLFMVEDAWQAVCYGDVEAWREALGTVERNWLAPLEEALRGGAIAELVLHTENRSLALDRRAARRWWRRPVAPVAVDLWQVLER
ncbi:MAG: hypothetical protein U5S82_04560 [Gammaproteobacteria bacterium]|nr:hypothetical protein [Gammaproteobacteria bacterium]